MKPVKIDFDALEERLAGGETLRSIARGYGISHQALSERRRQYGKPKLRFHRKITGGGRFVDRWGYVQVRTTDGRRRVSPYVPEHILVVESRLGRRLRTGECVHHINGHKTDNQDSNLLVCTRSTHRVLHRSLESLAMELVQRGTIVFDGTKYRWA